MDFLEQAGAVAVVVIPCLTGLAIVLSGKIDSLRERVDGLGERLGLVESDVRQVNENVSMLRADMARMDQRMTDAGA